MLTLTGSVYHRGEAGYESVRISSYNSTSEQNSIGNINTVFNSTVFPSTIVVAKVTADVINAVKWAAAKSQTVTARGGGHAYDGCSLIDGGLLIDVSTLRQIVIDDAGRSTVRIEAGAKIGSINDDLLAKGLALPMGTCSTVGIAGLTLGGGHGLLAREHGLTMDRLDSAQVVIANGSLVNASETSHPELFWALRGGGAVGLGVVTAFRFRAVPARGLFFYKQMRAWDQSAFFKWQSWAPTEDPASWHTVHMTQDGGMTFEGTYGTSIKGVNPDMLHDRVSAALGPWRGEGYGWPRIEYWMWSQAMSDPPWSTGR